ncbi:MAG: hypothetical protein LWW86_01275 [Micrococcales bacterium]|nr:hypothetical protein [Micrococcales bacterium]
MANHYSDLDGFADLYLEDSWVLDLVARPGVFEVEADLVLRQGHSEYVPPLAGEQYCYRKGVISFSAVSDLEWTHQGAPAAVDATGTTDFGTFTMFGTTPDGYLLDGDFGTIRIATGRSPKVTLQ